jgi:MFS family permease
MSTTPPEPSAAAAAASAAGTGGLARAAYALRWPALFVVLAAEVMDLLDALITSIAGPTIVADLGGGETLVQWLGAGYTLAMASGLLLGGRLGDIFGRRRMFLVGMAGFTLLSLVCALAQSPEMLIGSRVLQGLVGAVMLPQGLGLIKEMFPEDEVGKAFGTFGPVMGLSAVGGPILAGFLVDADLFGWGWRTIFAINVPIGLVALVAGLRLLPASRPDPTIRIELTSVAIAATSMFLLVYPLIQGQEHGWPAWTFAMIAAGVAGFALLARIEIARDRAGLVTLVTPSLFRKRAFTGGIVTGMALFGSLMGMSIAFTFFVQFGLGYSPLKAGLAGVAQAVGMVVGFIASEPFTARLGGRRLMHVGEAVAERLGRRGVHGARARGGRTGHGTHHGAVLRPGAGRRRRPGVRLGLGRAHVRAAARRRVRDRRAGHGLPPRPGPQPRGDPGRRLPRRRRRLDAARRRLHGARLRPDLPAARAGTRGGDRALSADHR